MYGEVLITWDPGLKNWSSPGSSPGLSGTNLANACVGLTLGDWVFITDADASFTPSSFVDLGETAEAGKDAKRALLKTHYRYWCERPWNQILWTNVTA